MPVAPLFDIPSYATMLEGLVGAPTTVEPGPAPAPAEHAGMAAWYVDEAGDVQAAVWWDLPLAAYAGAALSMVPAEIAEGCVAAGELSESLRENAHEVMNVTASLLTPKAARHLKLAGTAATPEAPAEVAPLLTRAVARTHLAVALEGFGTGKALVVVDKEHV